MKKSIIVFVTLFIVSVASLAQGRTAIGEMDSEQEFRIDTALIVKMRKVATTVGPTMIRFADSIAALHGGKVTPINYKSFQSTLRKCNTQKVQATELNDLVRCMIACPYDSLHSMITDLVQTARKKGIFTSIENLRRRSGISKTNIEILREHGCLAGMSESDQVSLFG